MLGRASLAVFVTGCNFNPGAGSIDAPIDDTLVEGIDAPLIDGPPIDGPPIDTPPFTGLVARVNLGAGAHTGVDYPGAWIPDPGLCAGATWSVTGQINGTVDDPLFLRHRYAIPTLTCALTGLPSGMYEVTFLFGPTYYGAGGTCTTTADQIFHIDLEGTRVASDFNLTQAAGGCVLNGPGVPVTRGFVLAVTDGTLNFVATNPASDQAAMFSAIQVIQKSAL
jgi:hypothetical protein